MNEKKVQQGAGIAKAIIIISAIAIWYIGSYILLVKSDINIYIAIGLQLIIGFFMIAWSFIGIWITDWIEKYLMSHEKATKEERDSVETKNVATEKKPSRVKELAKKMIPKKKVPESNLPGKKVDFGGTPLPIEEPITETKSPIEG